jgi:hypothetical protein
VYTSRTSVCLVWIFCSSTALLARQQTVPTDPKTPVITAANAGEKVRFSSVGSTAQIRMQILAADEASIFDSGWRDRNVLDWSSETVGRQLGAGSYRCVVAVKDLDGKVTERAAALTARDGQLSIEQTAGAESLTIVGPDEKAG